MFTEIQPPSFYVNVLEKTYIIIAVKLVQNLHSWIMYYLLDFFSSFSPIDLLLLWKL